MHYGTPTPHPGVTVLDVPLQGAQVATRCPVRADLDHAPALAALRAEPDPSELTRAELTQAHVLTTWAAVTDQTRVGGLETVVIDAPDRVTREEQTRAALQGSAQVIVGAQLPDDPDGRRRGRSMLLVRPAMSEPVGWVPVEIRRHAFTRPTTSGVMYRSPLSQPFPDQASPMTGVAPRTNRHNENGLALAHGWRLLVAAGATAPGQRAQGGLVDADGTLWWVDLEDPRWSTRWSPTPVTTLAHYDHAFGFRLEVIANRLARDRDPEVPRGVVPIRIGQCATCPWERVCRDELEAEDHLSLIPRSTYDHVLAHRDRGIESRRQVARLHWPTAWLIFGDGPRSEITDVSALIEAARQLPPSANLQPLLKPTPDDEARGTSSTTAGAGDGSDNAPLDPDSPDPTSASPSTRGIQLALPLGGYGPAEDPSPLRADGEDLAPPLDPDEATGLAAPAPVPTSDPASGSMPNGGSPDHPSPIFGGEVLLARLRSLGIITVADLSRVDTLTASYSGSQCGHLPTVIDEARATVSGTPFLARGLRRPSVRLADVEVDVDMENVEDGVYLWGTLVSGAADTLSAVGVDRGYRPFYSWSAVDPSVQLAVFQRFWDWLTDLRERCSAAGLTFAAYCYTSAEHQKMVQILTEAPAGPDSTIIDSVEALVSSPDWVDLYQLVRASLVVGHGLGLKRIAPLAGFSWRDPDAGGLQSMSWHRNAVTHPDPAVRASNRQRLLNYNEDDVRATHAVRHWLARAELPSIADWVEPSQP